MENRTRLPIPAYHPGSPAAAGHAVSGGVLGEILALLEVSSQLYFRAELSRPFAIAVPEQQGVIHFRAAAAGSCTIALRDGEPLAFGPGDLVLVPRGSAHVLADAPERPVRSLASVLDESGFDGTGPLVFGGGGPRTVLVCGHVTFADALLDPLVPELPPLLHLRAEEGSSYAWMEQVVRRMERESRSQAIGYVEVLRRLSEILLVEVLRAHGDHLDPGVLSALADPQLGRALQAMHAEPETDWSLDALARLAGHSRTLFVQRFRERVGTSPMRYLATWRLRKARRLLTSAGHSVGEVARRVGYASESAFSRAFREQFGEPPGRFRRARPAA